MMAKIFGSGWESEVFLHIEVNVQKKVAQIIGLIKYEDGKYDTSYYSHVFPFQADDNQLEPLETARWAMEAHSEHAYCNKYADGQGTFVNRVLCEAGYSPVGRAKFIKKMNEYPNTAAMYKLEPPLLLLVSDGVVKVEKVRISAAIPFDTGIEEVLISPVVDGNKVDYETELVLEENTLSYDKALRVLGYKIE